MKIHGFAFILIGIFVSGFSFLLPQISERIDAQKLLLFMYVGVGFILFGIFRLLQNRKPSTMKEKRQSLQPHASHHHADQGHPHHSQRHNPHVKYCPQRGSTMRHFDKFCYKCGNRL